MKKFTRSCILTLGIALIASSATFAEETLRFNGNGNWSSEANWENNKPPQPGQEYGVIVDSANPSTNDLNDIALRNLELRGASDLTIAQTLGLRSLSSSSLSGTNPKITIAADKSLNINLSQNSAVSTYTGRIHGATADETKHTMTISCSEPSWATRQIFLKHGTTDFDIHQINIKVNSFVDFGTKENDGYKINDTDLLVGAGGTVAFFGTATATDVTLVNAGKFSNEVGSVFKGGSITINDGVFENLGTIQNNTGNVATPIVITKGTFYNGFDVDSKTFTNAIIDKSPITMTGNDSILFNLKDITSSPITLRQDARLVNGSVRIDEETTLTHTGVKKIVLGTSTTQEAGNVILIESGAELINYGLIEAGHNATVNEITVTGQDGRRNRSVIINSEGATIIGLDTDANSKSDILLDNGAALYNFGYIRNVDFVVSNGSRLALASRGVFKITESTLTVNSASVYTLHNHIFETILFDGAGTSGEPSTFTSNIAYASNGALQFGSLTAVGTAELKQGTKIRFVGRTERLARHTSEPRTFVWKPLDQDLVILQAGTLKVAGKTIAGTEAYADGDRTIDVENLNNFLFNTTATLRYGTSGSNKLIIANVRTTRAASYESFSTPDTPSYGAGQALYGALSSGASTELAAVINSLDQSRNAQQLNVALAQLSPVSYTSGQFVVHEDAINEIQQFTNYRQVRRRAIMAKQATKLTIDPSAGYATLPTNPTTDQFAQALPVTPGEREQRKEEAEYGIDSAINIFARVTTGFTRVGASSKHIGLVSRRIGTIFGADFKVHENILVGFAGSYNHNDLGFKNGFGGGKIDSYRFGPYAMMFSGDWFFESELTFGIHENRIRRNAQLNGTNYSPKSRYRAYDFIANIGAGYDFEYMGITFTPRVNLMYQYYNSNGHTERNGAGTNLRVRRYQNSYITSRLGVDIAKRFEVDGVKSMTPFFNIGWRRDWLSPDNVEARFVGGGATFSTYNDLWSQNSIYLGFGGTIEVSDQLNIDLRYQADLGSNQNRSQNMYVSLRYQF